MFAHCVVPWRRAGTTGSRAGCWPSLRPSSSRPRGTASVTRCVAVAYRRKAYGAELGGDRTMANRHATLFVMLWFLYVAMSILASEGIV